MADKLKYIKLKKESQVYIVLIFSIVIFLSLFGLVAIYSASSYFCEVKYKDSFFFVKKQAVSFVAGIVFMIACSFIKLEYLKKYKYPLLIISYILLALVFVPGLSVENYGAKRWINLGAFTLQPSEIAKFLLMIFLAAYMSKKSTEKPLNFMYAFGCGLLMTLLIMLEPNMSITMCVLLSTIIMLFAGGAKIKFFIIMGIPLIIGVVLLIVLEPYRMARLMAFIDPWANPLDEGYQLIQSLYGLGSGGIFGVGIFNSRQKYLFLPFSESDFILSVIGEEIGLFGLTIILIIYLSFIIIGIKVAIKAKDRFHTLLAVGIITLIATQTLLNIAVVTGSIPPTGLPLPFISSGGTSLVAFMSASGLLVNVARNT